MKLHKKINILIVITIILSTVIFNLPIYAVETSSALNNSELNDYISEYIDKSKTPGLALTAVNNSDVEFRNWGYDNIEKNIAFSKTTPVELASVSKGFTALAIFLLQEEGKLSIEDSVSDYLSWFNVRWQGEECDIKIWQLLNHCSGIHENETMAKMKIGNDDYLKEETARIAEGIELKFQPGTSVEYCNLGYSILAYLVEVVSEKSFDEYVTQEIFLPLGMNNSGYDIPTAQGYKISFGKMIAYNAPRFKGAEGAAYATSTAEDMSIWMNAQLGNMELPIKLENAIKKSHEMPKSHNYIKIGEFEDGIAIFYINGWFQTEDGNYMEHSGGSPTFTTMLIIDKTNQVSVFAVSNSQTDTAAYATNTVYEMLLGNDFIKEKIVLDYTDTIASLITFIGVIVLIISRNNGKKILGLTLLIVFLILLIALPYIVGYNYLLAYIWLPFSAISALAIWIIDILFMIIVSIFRLYKMHLIAKPQE
jgi:CubicO group peptidase (beta-lactamase class C family)